MQSALGFRADTIEKAFLHPRTQILRAVGRDFGSELEPGSIGDCRLFRHLAEN
jgi:hypothetical protein